MQTVYTGKDMAIHRLRDFTSLQSRQNSVGQLNLDGIVCIPVANVSLCSCSDIKKYKSSSGKALTRSHYLMVSPFHNAPMFNKHFLSMTREKFCIGRRYQSHR